MKIRAKNPIIKTFIAELVKRGHAENRPVWIAIARALNRPRRAQKKVNLWKIEKYAKEGETVVVPTCVLGNGKLTKSVDVYAVRFSAKARKAITAAKGNCFDITEVMRAKPRQLRLLL